MTTNSALQYTGIFSTSNDIYIVMILEYLKVLIY